jgi:hypothetical protein
VDGGGIMLNANDLIEKMKLHFPRWMDIRKRITKSDGGKLLYSVAEETADIQKAIEDYKKDFFLEGYIGREDSIVAFVYKLHVGLLNITQLEVVTPKVTITDDLSIFYSQTGLAYYEAGNLFFREEDISNKKIIYKIDSFQTSGDAEKISVWNVFDEFATFMGLERHVNETNKELEQRILNVSRRRTNSSTQGLKNAILNELMFLDPELTEDEIDISAPTPENLVKYYKEFGSVIEKLAHVNRDVYRTKRWDLDSWNYTLKSVDYLPHAWDYAIDIFQNGVGFEKDLQVSLTNPNDTTNAVITFYGQSLFNVQEYIKKKQIKTDVQLKLSQYDNVLKPIMGKYKITASEVTEITALPIYINSSEILNGEEERYIEDIVSETKDIEIIDKSLLPDNKLYKLVFTPKSEYGTMEIQKCDLLKTVNNTTTNTSLLAEKPGYVFDSDGHLVNSNIKLYANQKSDFVLTQNILNVQEGMTIDDISREGNLELDLTGMAHQLLKMQYDCKLTAVPQESINKVGFELNQNIILCNSDPITKYVEVSMNANQISLDIISGN